MMVLFLRLLRFLRRALWVIIPYCAVLGIGIYVFKGYEGTYFPYSYHRISEQKHGGFVVLKETSEDNNADKRALLMGYMNLLSGDTDIRLYTLNEDGIVDTTKFALQLPQTTALKALRLSDTTYMMIVVDSSAVRMQTYSDTFVQLSDCILDQATRSYSNVQMYALSPREVFVQLGQKLYLIQQNGNAWSSREIAKDVVAIPMLVGDKPLTQLPFIRKSEQEYFLSIFHPESNTMTLPVKMDADTIPTIIPLHNTQFGVIVPTNLRTRALLYHNNMPVIDVTLPEAPAMTVWWGSTPDSTILHRVVVTANATRLTNNTVDFKQKKLLDTFAIALRSGLSYPLGFVGSPHGILVRFINGWAEINPNGTAMKSADINTTWSGDLLSSFNQAGRVATQQCYIDTETRNGEEYAVLYQRTHHQWYWAKNIVSNIRYLILASCLLGVFVVVVQKLRQYRRISYAIIKTPSAPITLVVDTNRRIVFESAKARELLVKNETISLQGRKISALGLDTTGKKVVAMIEQCFRENQNVTDDIEHIETRADKDEEILRVYDCTVSPMTSFGNHLRGVLLIGRDVTGEREKKEVEISWSIAHDMQTPLATINMATERLQRMMSSETLNTTQLRDAIKTIAVQSRNLSERVKDWKILAGKQIDKPVEADMKTLCETLVDDIGPGFYDESIHFVVDVAPHLVVLCYPNNITSALRNMISNSLRAIDQVHNRTHESSNTRHTLCIRVYREQAYPYCLIFEIGDTGIGIKKETLQKLNRGAIVTENQRKGGTGTGTRIVRECIRKHNARDAKKMRQAALEYESPSIMQNVRVREGVIEDVKVEAKVTMRLLPIYKRANDRQNNQQAGVEYKAVESLQAE